MKIKILSDRQEDKEDLIELLRDLELIICESVSEAKQKERCDIVIIRRLLLEAKDSIHNGLEYLYEQNTPKSFALILLEGDYDSPYIPGIKYALESKGITKWQLIPKSRLNKDTIEEFIQKVENHKRREVT